MSLFSSFIFPTNSFLSWIDKSFLGLARVSIGTKPSYFFRYFLAAIKSFPEKSHITYLYLFSQSSKYSTISSAHRSFLFISFCFTPMCFFFFLLHVFTRHVLSVQSVTFHYWHACVHESKLHQQGKLPCLERLFEGKQGIARPGDILGSATRYIACFI